MARHNLDSHLEQPDCPAVAAGLAVDWEATYRENLTWVYRYIYGRVGNRVDAEDAAAEVFMRALPRLNRAVPPAGFATLPGAGSVCRRARLSALPTARRHAR